MSLSKKNLVYTRFFYLFASSGIINDPTTETTIIIIITQTAIFCTFLFMFKHLLNLYKYFSIIFFYKQYSFMKGYNYD